MNEKMYDIDFFEDEEEDLPLNLEKGEILICSSPPPILTMKVTSGKGRGKEIDIRQIYIMRDKKGSNEPIINNEGKALVGYSGKGFTIGIDHARRLSEALKNLVLAYNKKKENRLD